MSTVSLVKSSPENSLSAYIQKIQQFPLLSAEEEKEYGFKVKNFGDIKAAKILIESHLRLVVKIAYGFKNYGFNVHELISEGNLGLMQAVKKFDPEKGFRLSTYAMWWIKAHIQEYILRSWSLVKIGTTAAQKKLFFNLRKIKNKIKASDSKGLEFDEVKTIASSLNVSESEVKEMNSRLSNSDSSLNKIIGHNNKNRDEEAAWPTPIGPCAFALSRGSSIRPSSALNQST